MMHFKDLSKQIYGVIYSVELTCFERKHWRLLSLKVNHVRDGWNENRNRTRNSWFLWTAAGLESVSHHECWINEQLYLYHKWESYISISPVYKDLKEAGVRSIGKFSFIKINDSFNNKLHSDTPYTTDEVLYVMLLIRLNHFHIKCWLPIPCLSESIADWDKIQHLWVFSWSLLLCTRERRHAFRCT